MIGDKEIIVFIDCKPRVGGFGVDFRRGSLEGSWECGHHEKVRKSIEK